MSIIITQIGDTLCRTPQHPPPVIRIISKSTIAVHPKITIIDEISCCICYEDVKYREILSCDHPICKKCSMNLNKMECPICRRELRGPSITSEVVKSIQQIIHKNQAKSRLSKQLIIRLIQRSSLSLCVVYNYDFNLMIEFGLSVMHGQDPFDFNINKKIKDRVCNEYVDLILDQYPGQDFLRESLFNDISAFFTVLDIDM
jgi:Zinc finger, C3HC4 type (RING finger)